ncbi:MAG TPA: hypothetical protein PKL48_11800 [Thermodesulfobacteriota bacterium]|nr:hypothetical protein [Thermodesulfobacteriota bacterium]
MQFVQWVRRDVITYYQTGIMFHANREKTRLENSRVPKIIEIFNPESFSQLHGEYSPGEGFFWTSLQDNSDK